MITTIYQVDAFTSKIFSGNPAGVCILPAPVDEPWMQNVAREMNVSETAFVYRDINHFNIRFFTPMQEIDLCGHATLSAAHILWSTGVCRQEDVISFQSNRERLTAKYIQGWIELNFPAMPETRMEIDPALEDALGVKAQYMGRSNLMHLVEVVDPVTLKSANPNFSELARLSNEGVLLTCLSPNPEFDFISRCFFPNVGINEDPVTGIAHCMLTPYWHKRLGKTQFTALQASARTGILKLRLEGERVVLAGQAVISMKCELLQ